MKRIFLSGPTSSITEDDLNKRFSSFGSVSNIVWAKPPKCFVHFTLDGDEEACKRMLSAYNGTRWRNSTIKIEEAKPDWKEALEERRLSDAKSISNEFEVKSVRRRIRESSKIDEPVTDQMVDSLSGWVRSKYGRAVMLGHIRRLDGTVITVDPSHYKENLQKLFGSVKPLPIYKLAHNDVGVVGDGECSSDNSDNSDNGSDDGDDTAMNIDDNVYNNTKADDSNISGTKNSTEKVEQQQKQEQQQQEQEEEEEVFSLSKLIGLPVEQMPKPVKVEKIPQNKEDKAEAEKRREKVIPSMISCSTFLLRDIPPNSTYYRKYGGEEAYMFWREGRQKLRLDFKSKIKQVRKMARRNNNK